MSFSHITANFHDILLDLTSNTTYSEFGLFLWPCHHHHLLSPNSSVQFICSVVSDSLRPCGLQHARLPCPSTPEACSNKLMSIESVIPSNHLILCHPLLIGLKCHLPPNGSFWKWKCELLSCVWLCENMGCSPPGPLSLGFPRQEYWSGLPFPSPGYLPDPGIKPASPVLAGKFFT